MVLHLNMALKEITSDMKINGYLENSTIYGINEPAFAIWFQGCSIRCNGCWNKDMWDKNSGYEIKVEKLLSIIANSHDACVTILGGEPFDQYNDLYALVSGIKKLGKNIILYTGYEWKDGFIGGHPDKILEHVDVFVCGPYIETRRTLDNHLIGSNNQQIYFLTHAYRQDDMVDGTYVEIRIDKNAGIEIFGYPDDFTSER